MIQVGQCGNQSKQNKQAIHSQIPSSQQIIEEADETDKEEIISELEDFLVG